MSEHHTEDLFRVCLGCRLKSGLRVCLGLKVFIKYTKAELRICLKLRVLIRCFYSQGGGSSIKRHLFYILAPPPRVKGGVLMSEVG